jgi:hypothetical protein
MVVAAPKICVTGFHVVEVRKFTSPNFPRASDDSLTSTARIPTMKIMMVKEAMAVREENNRSTTFFLGKMAKERTFLFCRVLS